MRCVREALTVNWKPAKRNLAKVSSYSGFAFACDLTSVNNLGKHGIAIIIFQAKFYKGHLLRRVRELLFIYLKTKEENSKLMTVSARQLDFMRKL